MFCVRASLLGGHIAWRFWVTDDGYMKDICWGYVRSRSFLKGRARKSVIIYIAFTSNFFSQPFFPSACNFFFLTRLAGGASLFVGLHDFCGLVESRTIASPPLERCSVSYRIFSRRGCQVVSWLYIGPRVWRNLSEPKNRTGRRVLHRVAWRGLSTPGHSNPVPFSADV